MSDLRVCGVAVELATPTDLMERWQIVTAMQEAQGRGDLVVLLLPAVLVLCWPEARRKAARKGIAYRGDLREFSPRVVEWLTTQPTPATMQEVLAAGRVAYQLALDSLVSGQAVQAATDFSPAPAVPSPASSSTSSAPGDESRGGSAPSIPSSRLD